MEWRKQEKKKRWLKDFSGDMKGEEDEASATGELNSYMLRNRSVSSGNDRYMTKYISLFFCVLHSKFCWHIWPKL
jgi:hypothetical protein